MKNILRELRADRGWSQADLAEKLNVSRQTVNAIETGRYDPSLPLAIQIARLFHKRVESLLAVDLRATDVERNRACACDPGDNQNNSVNSVRPP